MKLQLVKYLTQLKAAPVRLQVVHASAVPLPWTAAANHLYKQLQHNPPSD